MNNCPEAKEYQGLGSGWGHLQVEGRVACLGSAMGERMGAGEDYEI